MHISKNRTECLPDIKIGLSGFNDRDRVQWKTNLEQSRRIEIIGVNSRITEG